jgi:hypothetical protein
MRTKKVIGNEIQESYNKEGGSNSRSVHHRGRKKSTGKKKIGQKGLQTKKVQKAQGKTHIIDKGDQATRKEIKRITKEEKERKERTKCKLKETRETHKVQTKKNNYPESVFN